METLVLPSQDQLSQHHQYWKSHNAFGNPLLVTPQSYLPHPPLCRSTSSAPNFSSPVPVAASFPGSCSPRRKSPENAPRSRGNPRANKLPKNAGVKKGLSSAGIKILQRPASQEAAMLDLAKITGLPLGEVYSRNGLSPPPAENLKTPESKLVKSQSHSHHKQVKKAVRNEGGLFCSKSFLEEKWAGPAFSNSPPPSSLPIPNFFLRKSEQSEGGEADFEAATRGLRKILNLEL